MANTDSAFGLLPVRHLNGASWDGRFNEYPIASAYGTNLLPGDPVKMVSGGTIERAAAGDPILGVFIGCRYTAANDNGILSRDKKYWPASTVAAQQLRRTLELIEKREGRDKKSESGDELLASALEQDRAQREEMVDSLKEPPLLKPISSQPIDLMMSEQSKIVFETIAKLAGVNVLFDPDFQDKKIDIEIRGATLSEALDYVSLIAKKYWKPISDNAIFITDDNKAVLIDFGAAKEEATRASRALSALHVVKDGYSPHEFYLAGSTQDASSDLYSLGATFYHVLTGMAPPDSQARVSAIAADRPDP